MLSNTKPQSMLKIILICFLSVVSFSAVNLFFCFLYFVFMDIYYWNCGLYDGLYNNLNNAIIGGQIFAWANSYGKLLIFTSITSLFVVSFFYFSLTKIKYASIINIVSIILFLLVFGLFSIKLFILSSLVIYVIAIIAIIALPALIIAKHLYKYMSNRIKWTDYVK
jgi:hypothetical protein